MCPKGHSWIRTEVPSAPNMESEQGQRYNLERTLLSLKSTHRIHPSSDMCHSIGLQLTTTQLTQPHILERVLTGTTSDHQTSNAGNTHTNEMDVTAILGLEVQNTKTARDFEEQKQGTNCLLPKEPEWTESAVNPQCMVNDIGLSSVSTMSQHDLADKPKESREQNSQLRRKMKEQEDINLNLKQSHKKAVRRF